MEKPQTSCGWGPEDEAGALNWVTPEKIQESVKLVREGKFYNLAHTLEPGIPVHWLHGGFLYFTFRSHSETFRQYRSKNNFGAMGVRLEMGDHTGTHIDGLNHVSEDLRLYNGHRVEEVTGAFGTSKLGIDKTPPVITRGILVDMASFNHMKRLPADHLITSEEIQALLRKKDLTIREGDAVLIATGWSKLWMKDNEKYAGNCPGIGVSAGKWLAKKRVSVVGSDTWKVEIHPSEKGVAAPVHQLLIIKNGIRMIENLDLEELRKRQIDEFLFVCLPLMVKGGTGSPVTPVALV